MTTEADLARWLMLKLLARVLRRIRDRGFPHVAGKGGGGSRGHWSPAWSVETDVPPPPSKQKGIAQWH